MNLIEQISKELIEAIAKDEAPFKCIPAEVGKLRFCCTTNAKTEPYTKEERKKKLVRWIGCCILIPLMCWLIFNDSSGFNIFISVICLVVAIKTVINIRTFKGIDYFVGDDGFASVSFSGRRDNIVKRDVHTYNEFSQLITGETIKKQNGCYIGTDYFFGFFSAPLSTSNKGVSQVRLVLDEGGTYHQEKEDDQNVCEHYLFWKNIERIWTSRKLSELQINPDPNGTTFSLLVNNDNSSTWESIPYISIVLGKIIVGGRVYDCDTLKGIGFENGNLVIEHINHSKKLFGLLEKGNIEKIPLTNLGNRELFFLYLNSAFNFERC